MLFGSDEPHPFVKDDFGLGAAVHLVGELAVDADGGDGHAGPLLVQTVQYIVETHGLAGVLLHPHNGQAAVFQYLVYKRHNII